MRELKFRVWNGDTFYYPVHKLRTSNCDETGAPCVFQQLDNCSHLSDKCVIQQFTGQKDKDGQDIYEGDILYHIAEKLNVVIKFNNSAFVFRNKKHPEDGYVLADSYQEEMIIVGNIFENPDLI